MLVLAIEEVRPKPLSGRPCHPSSRSCCRHVQSSTMSHHQYRSRKGLRVNAISHRRLNDRALLQNLLHNLLVLARAKFRLQLGLGSGILHTLVALPIATRAIVSKKFFATVYTIPIPGMAGYDKTYLCVTKTFQPLTTCASGTLLSFFHSCTASFEST